MKTRYSAFVGAGVAAVLACGTVTPALAAPASVADAAIVQASVDAVSTQVTQTQIPTLRPGYTGKFTLRITAPVYGKGLSYTVTAPEGTTFASATREWKSSGGFSGSDNESLSADKRTITLSNSKWEMMANGWVDETYTLKSDAGNTREGTVDKGGVFTVTGGNVLPVGDTQAVVYKASTSLIEQSVIPSLSPAYSGNVTFRMYTPANKVGMNYTFTAPKGTTFLNSTRSWKNSKGASGSGAVTLSSDKRTISVNSPLWGQDFSVDGWVDETFTLVADAGNTEKGLVEDGKVEVVGGASQPIGTTGKIAYTAADSNIKQNSIPKIAPGEVKSVTVSVTNPSTSATAAGTTYKITAPDGTTFASNLVTWSDANGTKTGTHDTTMSSDKRTLTISVPSFVIDGSTVREFQFSLRSDADNTRTGVVSDGGSFGFTAGAALPAGAKTSVSYESTYVAPKPIGVTLSAPAAGAVITDTKNPVFSGKGQPGATVTVTGNSGATIATAVVDKDGTWTATSAVALYNGGYLGTVSQDVDGSSVPYSFSLNVQNNKDPKEPQEPEAPVTAITLSSPAIGGTTTASNPVFTGKGQPGAIVEVKGSSGRVIASATVDAKGEWSATSSVALGLGRYVGTVVQTAGDTVSSAAFDYSIVRSAKQVTLLTPAVGGKTTASNPVFTGKGQAGAKIEVKGNSGRVIASATVDAQGNWSATSTVALGLGHYLGTVEQNAGGEMSQVAFDYSIVRAATQVTLTSPAIGATVTELTPTFTGKGEAGATIEVKGNSGKVIATATVDAKGDWSATSTIPLWEGHFIGSVHQDADGELSQTGFDYVIKK